jgi:putative flippase GtrA
MPFINNLYFKFRHYFSRRFPQLYDLCEKRKSVIKFFIAGCFAGGSDLVFLFIFHGIFRWPIVLSTSLAFILSFAISFTMQKFWTFRNYNQDKVFRQLAIYFLNAFLGLNLNGFLMHIFVNEWSVWYILSQIIVNLAIAVWNFIVYKYIVFKNQQDENNS